MKYPIFGFVVGGFFVEFVHVLASGNKEGAFLIGVAILVSAAIGATFEAVWNFK